MFEVFLNCNGRNKNYSFGSGRFKTVLSRLHYLLFTQLYILLLSTYTSFSWKGAGEGEEADSGGEGDDRDQAAARRAGDHHDPDPYFFYICPDPA